MVQQQFYGQRFPNSISQPAVQLYNTYPMYSSTTAPTQTQYNSYDHVIQSAAETLAAFNQTSEKSVTSNSQQNLPQSNPQQSANRRSTKTFSSTSNSTRMYYCETCRIACGGHATYQAHLNGSKHKKKELVTQNQQISKNPKISTGILRCELCDITCTSSDAYKAHLEGSKHDKAMKLHRKLGKTIPSAEPQLLNNLSSSSQSNSNPQASTSSSENSTNENQHISLSQLLENSIQPIGEEYIETTYDSSNKPILYHCKLCECKLNDIKGKDMHLKGKRHRLSYRKKVNPSFVVDNTSNNKPSSPKQRQITVNHNHMNDIQSNNEYANPQQQINNSYSQSDIDDDTKCLMVLHEQIIPTQHFLNIVEQFVRAVESALKSCSENLQTSITDNDSSTSQSNIAQSPLMGVSRIGLLGKSLIIKTDRLFHIVVISTEWPTKTLLKTVVEILPHNFQDDWKNHVEIEHDVIKETIQLKTDTDEGTISILIHFTSPSIEKQDKIQNESDEFLSKANCFNSLQSIYSTRWFQNQVSPRQHASALVRCLRYKTIISKYWHSLPSEAIEILINYALSQSLSAIQAFRRVLEYLSGGLVLSSGPGLCMPWQTETKKNIFEYLSNQERNDITQESQNGLRLLSFGQISKWLETSTISQFNILLPKRSYDYSDSQISVKRQCLELK